MGSVVSSIMKPVNQIIGGITGANDAKQAANDAAASQRQAATNASIAAQFRPVGMTTAFGTSNFTRSIDPATGMPYISSASYQASPQIQALQNQVLGNLGTQYNNAQNVATQYSPLLGGASGAFNLASKYFATSPEEAASTWYNQQQGLLAGGREQQLAGLRNKLFQTGRTGLATGGTTTGMAATNPELAAYYNALSQENRQLAAQADQYGMNRVQFGAGLFGTGSNLLNQYNAGQVASYSPFQNQLGISSTIENMALQPYQLGIQLGQAAAPGQAAGAQMYNQGFGQAAGTQYAGAQNAANLNSSFLSSLISSATGGFGGGGTPSPTYKGPSYGTNPAFSNSWFNKNSYD